jgi:hypothetical protein
MGFLTTNIENYFRPKAMLSIVLEPAAFPLKSPAGFLSVLQDVQRACYLQVGKLDMIALGEALPAGYAQKTAKTLLSRLHKRNRVLRCNAVSPLCEANFPCDQEYSCASYAIGVGNADCPTIDLEQYIGSDISERIGKSDYSIVNREVKANFQSTILRPLFRFAKTVYFVDHLLGSKWGSNRDFKASMLWYLEVLASLRKSGIPTKLFTYADSRSSESILATWCRDKGIRLENRLYKAGNPKSLPHERYIITDSIGVCIAKGLDLLHAESVSQSGIFVIEDAGTIIDQCHQAERPRFA